MPTLSPGPSLSGANILARAAAGSAGARRVDIAPHQILGRAGMRVDDIYLIETGLVSAMASAGKNQWVEAYLIGPSGLVGLPSLALDAPSPTKKVVQVGGTAVRVSARAYRLSLESSPALMTAALAYLSRLVVQTAQTGVCNGQHSAPERVCRWLTVASQMAGLNRLTLSHAALAKCLGLRRATVSTCLERLERLGAVALERKSIELRSPRALSARACDCGRYFGPCGT